MHATIAYFVLYDLNNYEGRLRRLKGINGTSNYTQLIRYGKRNFQSIVDLQNRKRTAHFKNIDSYWINLGYTKEEAEKQVSHIQAKRSNISAEKTRGVSIYSCRSLSFWINRGLTESQAKEKVKEIQSTNGLDFYVKKYGEAEGRARYDVRIKQWLSTLNSKTEKEKDLINKKKSHSVSGFIARGNTLEDALAKNQEYRDRMRAKPNQTWSIISQDLFTKLDSKIQGTTYYQTKNYEYLIYGYRVDFFHKESGTVIEFYGDFFLRNPLLYEADFTMFGYSSTEKWNTDNFRVDKIKKSKNVRQLIVVWESDYRRNPTMVINNLADNILGKSND